MTSSAQTEPRVVTKEEYQADYDRGYTISVTVPEKEVTLRDHRTGKTIIRKEPAVLRLQCMMCQFDQLDNKRGRELMLKHIENGKHPWNFSPFENPYGHIADVVIEGIEDYSQLFEGEE